jgi:hypothetical protein
MICVGLDSLVRVVLFHLYLTMYKHIPSYMIFRWELKNSFIVYFVKIYLEHGLAALYHTKLPTNTELRLSRSPYVHVPMYLEESHQVEKSCKNRVQTRKIV